MRIDLRAFHLSLAFNSLAFMLFFFLLRTDLPEETPVFVDLSFVELKMLERAPQKSESVIGEEIRNMAEKPQTRASTFKDYKSALKEEGSKMVEKSQMESWERLQEQRARIGRGGELRTEPTSEGIADLNGQLGQKATTEAPQGSKSTGSGGKEGDDKPATGFGSGVGRVEEGDYELVYRRQNFEVVRAIVKSHLEYPPLARLRGWEGRVVVYICLEGRSLCGLYVKESSGYRVLDEAVLKAVQKAHREFPYAEQKVNLVLPVQFSLREER